MAREFMTAIGAARRDPAHPEHEQAADRGRHFFVANGACKKR